MLKAMSKPQGVLKMFMLGVLKTILETVLKYKKNTITLYGTCWNWAADFVFLLWFCMSYWSETYISVLKVKYEAFSRNSHNKKKGAELWTNLNDFKANKERPLKPII